MDDTTFLSDFSWDLADMPPDDLAQILPPCVDDSPILHRAVSENTPPNDSHQEIEHLKQTIRDLDTRLRVIDKLIPRLLQQ
jgi:hypothetical protein